MFIGETEVKYVLDFISFAYEEAEVWSFNPLFKSTLKKWIQTYGLQDEYKELWDEVSTGS